MVKNPDKDSFETWVLNSNEKTSKIVVYQTIFLTVVWNVDSKLRILISWCRNWR